jgi:hypothetical protein
MMTAAQRRLGGLCIFGGAIFAPHLEFATKTMTLSATN